LFPFIENNVNFISTRCYNRFRTNGNHFLMQNNSRYPEKGICHIKCAKKRSVAGKMQKQGAEGGDFFGADEFKVDVGAGGGVLTGHS
jgi:hypothetical protein